MTHAAERFAHSLRGWRRRRPLPVVVMALLLVACARTDRAPRATSDSSRALVVFAPDSPSASTPASPAIAASSAAAQAALDSSSFTDRFETPEVVFHLAPGERASGVSRDSGAVRALRVEGGSDGGGPSYAVDVNWYPLAPSTTLEAWAALHADAEHDDEAEEKAAAGGPPIPAGYTEPDTIRGRPALRQSLSGPADLLESRYVVAGPWVLVFRWAHFPEPGPGVEATHAGPLALLDRLEWRRD